MKIKRFVLMFILTFGIATSAIAGQAQSYSPWQLSPFEKAQREREFYESWAKANSALRDYKAKYGAAQAEKTYYNTHSRENCENYAVESECRQEACHLAEKDGLKSCLEEGYRDIVVKNKKSQVFGGAGESRYAKCKIVYDCKR